MKVVFEPKDNAILTDYIETYCNGVEPTQANIDALKLTLKTDLEANCFHEETKYLCQEWENSIVPMLEATA